MNLSRTINPMPSRQKQRLASYTQKPEVTLTCLFQGENDISVLIEDADYPNMLRVVGVNSVGDVTMLRTYMLKEEK